MSFTNFNPRSREGSDRRQKTIEVEKNISIHAPAKGATYTNHILFLLSSNFNPRSREGSDFLTLDYIAKLEISIHAPAKGATNSVALPYPSNVISIHAPAKGATGLCNFISFLFQFQSTLPRRERLSYYTFCFVVHDFNPRSREGSDLAAAKVYQTTIKFQSTLPRRERLKAAKQCNECARISIHAPAKGATERL